MKRYLLIFLLIAMILVGCDPKTHRFMKDDYINKIDRIELVYYNNSDYQMVNPTDSLIRFDSSKIIQNEVLSMDRMNDFLSDFESNVFHFEDKSVNEPTGYCLLWYLKNGNFIVFSCTMIQNDRAYSMVSEFDSTSKFLSHYAYFADRPNYEKILKKYFKSYNTNKNSVT